MEITLLRHAEPARGDDAAARSDPGLSARGMAQAHRVAAFLTGERHDALYVSPLRRARETARIVAAAVGLDPVVVDGLAEFDRSTGYTHVEDLRGGGDPRYAAYLAGDLSPWGTTAETFRAEVLAAVEQVAERHSGQRVVLVTHGGVQNVLLAAVLGLPGLAFHAPDYASVSRLRAGPGGRRTLLSINETGHLRDPSLDPTR